MRRPEIRIITAPTVIPVFTSQRLDEGLAAVARWVAEERPECFPEGADNDPMRLFPHGGAENGRTLTDAELLVEFAGRECYHSYGDKAGRKTNRDYIANTQGGDIPHASIMYHPSFTFFVAGVSRRLSQELMRHNIGAERDWRGNPSQESTRYTEHVGSYVAHPRDVEAYKEGRPGPLMSFREKCQHDYEHYLTYIDAEIAAHSKTPTGMDRKRIYEAAAQRHGWGFATTFVWTGNAVSLGKLFRERDHDKADLEFRALAKAWKAAAVPLAPNLFQAFWGDVGYVPDINDPVAYTAHGL